MHWQDAVHKSPVGLAFRYDKIGTRFERDWQGHAKKQRRGLLIPAEPYQVDGYMDWEPVDWSKEEKDARNNRTDKG